MQTAIEGTAAGYEAAMRVMRPGVTEAALQDAIEGAHRSGGLKWPAFNTIVGAGINGTILHYMINEGVAAAGELALLMGLISVASGMTGLGRIAELLSKPARGARTLG